VLVASHSGTGIVFSASSFWRRRPHNDYAVYLKRQLVRVLIGLALLFIASRLDYHGIGNGRRC